MFAMIHWICIVNNRLLNLILGQHNIITISPFTECVKDQNLQFLPTAPHLLPDIQT